MLEISLDIIMHVKATIASYTIINILTIDIIILHPAAYLLYKKACSCSFSNEYLLTNTYFTFSLVQCLISCVLHGYKLVFGSISFRRSFKCSKSHCVTVCKRQLHSCYSRIWQVVKSVNVFSSMSQYLFNFASKVLPSV